PPVTPASPVPVFMFSPSSPVVGSPISFNGSSSTCYASPCSYNWTDDADKSVLGTGATMSFTFSVVGTNYVRLTVTDAQSQTASVEHDVLIIVNPAPPVTPASPVPVFMFSPSSPVVGSPISFNGSSSTCYASPCSYNWTDDADKSVLGTGATMSFTFSVGGTKYVRLTVTDAQSQTASVEHDVSVVAPAPPPPPLPP